MDIDLKKKSEELKDFVSQYQTSIFLGDISSLMQFISTEKPTKSLQGLSSPLRQLYYVAALNLTSNEKQPSKPQYSDDEWEHIKNLLNEIEAGYDQFFMPEKPEDVTDDWKMKVSVAMPTFLSYFNQGPLNYEEQIIERIANYFTPFDALITAHFGLGVQEFIDIYNLIDSLPNKFLTDNINPKEGDQSWQDFGQEMMEKGLMPNEWNDHLPERYKNLFNFMYDKGSMYRFTIDQLAPNYDKTKIERFLGWLTCQRQETNFLYYTEPNILYSQPIFKIDADQYQSLETKQIIHAVYNNLFKYCISDAQRRERFYKVRGEKLEDKIEETFQSFFDNKAFVYRSFFTQDGNEQDLLFLIDGFAFIVEAKASKRDEPRRDPDKAYPLILSNFDETIQKGYDQAYRVKSKFLNRETLKIYRNQQLTQHLIDIRTKNYHGAYSVIVTLERFGQMQTDLNDLLQIWDDDTFPWSVCIDDLEVFLLYMKKKKKKASDLASFLQMREKLHGHLICSDELEVCGGYLTGTLTNAHASSDDTLALTPDLVAVFDEAYHKGGLGFTNEKNMHYKTSDKYMIIGGH